MHDSATGLLAAVAAGRGVALVIETFASFASPRVKIRAVTPALLPVIIGGPSVG
jgi:hypothetical protein